MRIKLELVTLSSFAQEGSEPHELERLTLPEYLTSYPGDWSKRLEQYVTSLHALHSYRGSDWTEVRVNGREVASLRGSYPVAGVWEVEAGTMSEDERKTVEQIIATFNDSAGSLRKSA